MERPEPFLSEEEMKKRGEAWSHQARKDESPGQGYMYHADRKESNDNPSYSIERLHGTSFIQDILPQIIARKKPEEKAQVLEIGAGAGVYSEQLRAAFGNRIKVHSTGLSKQMARKARENPDSAYVTSGPGNISELKNEPLKKEDLKWRSIAQLSDFPEFDLIIDSFGEMYYNPKTLKDYQEYLWMVTRKLAPQGMASIYPMNPKSFRLDRNSLKHTLTWLQKQEGVSAFIGQFRTLNQFFKSPNQMESNWCLKILKP